MGVERCMDRKSHRGDLMRLERFGIAMVFEATRHAYDSNFEFLIELDPN